MSPFMALLLTVFFSLPHILGGGAIGQGIRAIKNGSDASVSLFLWGAIMGGLPVVFDWFFLILPGYVLNGLVGPSLFLVAMLMSAFLDLHFDGSAVLSAVLGSGAVLVGILAVPLMLDALRTSSPQITDYVCGGGMVVMFIAIGGSFAWNGFSAMIRGITFDQEMAERETKDRTPHPRKKR